MKWIAFTAAVLAVAACGGSSDCANDAGAETPKCYELVLNSRESSTVCNYNTKYELACLKKQLGACGIGSSDYQCVYVRGERVGVQFRTTCMPGLCYRYALDNQSCCNATDPGGDVEAWKCG